MRKYARLCSVLGAGVAVTLFGSGCLPAYDDSSPDSEAVDTSDGSVGDVQVADVKFDGGNEGGPESEPTDATVGDSASREAGPLSDDGASRDTGASNDDSSDSDGAACTPGAPCVPGACQLGKTSCDGGVQECTASGAATDGTQCDDAGSVCSRGACVGCAIGTDCSEAGSCQSMQISCASGPQCTSHGNQPNGSPCGGRPNLYCNDGTCAPCTNGAPCVPSSNQCHIGKVTCSGGAIVCTDTMANANAGTPCGTNQVCNAAGQCVPCISEAPCAPGGNACQTGKTSCTTGQQTCVPTGNVKDTTPCDDGNPCTQTDTCQSGTCTGSSPIMCTASDPCHVPGTCNPATGVCPNPAPGNNGASCTGTDKCYQSYACQNGICAGHNSVICTASDQCHTAGTCAPTTGVCSNPVATGANCTVANATTANCSAQGVCLASVCQSGYLLNCPGQSQCSPSGLHQCGSCGTDCTNTEVHVITPMCNTIAGQCTYDTCASYDGTNLWLNCCGNNTKGCASAPNDPVASCGDCIGCAPGDQCYNPPGPPYNNKYTCISP
jgi:hypothetical protein